MNPKKSLNVSIRDNLGMQLIEDCENRESLLTEGEHSFIDSIKTQVEEGRSLSIKQTEVLNSIWEKCTATG